MRSKDKLADQFNIINNYIIVVSIDFTGESNGYSAGRGLPKT